MERLFHFFVRFVFVLFFGVLTLTQTTNAQGFPYGAQLIPGTLTNFGGMDQAPNGDYYLVGNTVPIGGAVIVRYSESRIRKNSFQVNTPGGMQISDVAAEANGCAILGTVPSGEMVVIRTDSTGIIQWSKKYSVGNPYVTNTIQKDASGNYYFSSLQGSPLPILTKTDPNGNLLWSQRMLNSGISQIRCAIPARNGGAIITGTFDSDIYLTRLDASGNTMWAKTIPLVGSQAGLFIKELSNGDIAFSGYDYSSNRFGYVFRTTSAGDLLWARSVIASNMYLINVNELPSGDIQVSGDDDFTFYETVLADFSPSGTFQYGYRFNPGAGTTSFEGRGKSHFVDRSGKVHIVGEANARGGARGGYWTVFSPGNSTSLCDRRTQSFTVQNLSWNLNSESTLFTSVNQLVTNLTATRATVSLCPEVSCSGTPSIGDFLGPNRLVCPGDTSRIVLSASSVAGTYTWSTGATGPTISVSQPGVYWVRVTGVCGTFSDTVRLTPTVPSRFRLDSAGPLRFCAPGQVRLFVRGLPQGYSIRWNNGATDSSIIVSTTGSYSAVISNLQGCTVRTDTLSVQAYLPPQAPILRPTGSVYICSGTKASLQLANGVVGNRYVWSTGAVDSLQIRVDTGTYFITAISAQGCSTRSNTMRVLRILPNQPTTIRQTGPAFPCTGDSVVLTATGPDPIRWNTGAVGPSIVVLRSGQYWAQAGDPNGCGNLPSDTLSIRINPRPAISAGPDRELCEGDSALLGTVDTSGILYQWSPVTQLSSATIARPTVRALNTDPNDAPQTTLYTLVTTQIGTGCTSRDTVAVRVHSRYELTNNELPYCDPVPWLIPSVVTPNRDDHNDFFYIKALPYYRESTLRIYNRFGGEVYTASPYHNDWDGGDLPAGTYYYHLQLPKTGRVFKGWVEVVK